MYDYECSVCYWRLCGCGDGCLQRDAEEFCEYFTSEDEDADAMMNTEEGRKEYRSAWWDYTAQFE